MHTKRPFVGTFKAMPLSRITTVDFINGDEYSAYFDMDKSLHWGVLINKENGLVELTSGRPLTVMLKTMECESMPVPVIGKYIKSIEEERTYDIARLASGKIIGISGDQVCLYSSDEEMYVESSTNNLLS